MKHNVKWHSALQYNQIQHNKKLYNEINAIYTNNQNNNMD